MIRLMLNTPDQHDFVDPSVELDARRLRKLLSGLPVLNLGESLRIVLNVLEPLNEQKLDCRQRLKLLEVYLPTARQLYDTAEPLRLRQLPLSRQQRLAIIDDVERLCSGMANGFKIVIQEWYRGGRYEKDLARFGQLLRWALLQLGCQLVHSYRFYRPLPPFLFLELNQLYRLARHLGQHEQTGDDEGALSLAAVYQALSMLALCDPFHLAEGQVDAWYRTLIQYAPQCRIVPGNSWKGVPEGLFFVDFVSDSHPRPCVFLSPPVEGEDPHLLDARRALQDMHKALAALPADRRRQRPEAGILRALLPEVDAGDKRRQVRRSDGHQVEALTGIDMIHAWLSQPPPDHPGAPPWQVRDVSEQGYRLARDENTTGELGAGELICVLSEGSRPQLGLVRWVRNERGVGTEIGVERLDGVPAPVRLLAGDEGDGEHRALFLPSGNGQPARLVASKGVYRPGRALNIVAGDKTVAVCCTDCVVESPLLDCFEFTSG